MKKSKLYEIQDVAIQIANTLATMLQVDVEIIDSAHMRVAATGHFACRVNQSNVGDGHAYRDTLETGKKMFIDNPGQNPYCVGCKEIDTCDALLEVSAPIIVDDRIKGAIGMTCYKEDREQFMAEHFQESMFFLEQMCMLVAGKIKERTNLQKHLSASRMLHAMMGIGAAGRKKQNRINLSNTFLFSSTSFSYVLLRLIRFCFFLPAAPGDVLSGELVHPRHPLR